MPAVDRIAILLPDLRGGGAERVSLHLAREMCLERGYAVDFVLMREEGELLPLVPEGARIVGLNAPRVRNMIGPLAGYLRRTKPAVILASMWPLTSVAVVARMLARCRARLLVIDHTLLTLAYAGRGALHRALLRASTGITYRLADARVAVSAGVADDLAALSGIRRQDFDVVYNPIATPSAAQLADADAIWGVPPGRRILTVGTLKAEKNHAMLIRAFAQLRGWEDARLMLLGEGGMRGDLEALAAAEGVGARVLMPGFALDPAPYYRSADLFVLSSDREGLPTVIVEALACGVPVVSTDCRAGPAEILDGGRFGRLVPTGDTAAMAEAMRSALYAEHDRAALQRRAGDFSVARAADRYLELMFPDKAPKAVV